MRDHNYYVYILTRARNSVFYVGVTNNLIRRVYEHFEDINTAISREKIIKKWKRQYKINAIESMNPQWKDLYFELI